MKKPLRLISILILVLCFMSCGDQNTNKEGSKVPSTAPTKTATMTPSATPTATTVATDKPEKRDLTKYRISDEIHSEALKSNVVGEKTDRQIYLTKLQKMERQNS